MKIISRIALINNRNILLVKNLGNDYWSLPGGHWEYELESLRQCAERELKEETGISGQANDVLFSQEFTSKNSKVIEFIWAGTPSQDVNVDEKDIIDHTDTDPESEIETVRWFSISDIDNITIKPDALRQYFKGQVITRSHVES